eukprot:COSAG05_NODE_2014_length_3697_cov_2.478043_5_plen_82_part_00
MSAVCSCGTDSALLNDSICIYLGRLFMYVPRAGVGGIGQLGSMVLPYEHQARWRIAVCVAHPCVVELAPVPPGSPLEFRVV